MIKKTNVQLHKFNEKTLMLEFLDREIEIDTTFKAFNLRAHQCVNLQNIETMIDNLKEGITDQPIEFLKQLQKQAEIIAYALRTVESGFACGTSIEIQ